MAEKPKKTKRFKYNLETVLKVRVIRETQEQEKYNIALQELEEEKKKEEALIKAEKEAYEELRKKISEGIPDVQDILVRKIHLERLVEKIKEQTEKRKEAEKKVEEQRIKLIEAMRDKKIIEKDKEKKGKVWKKFMDKEDSKFLDDIATIGYQFRKRESDL